MSLETPRIRWAGIAFGILFAVAGAVAIWAVASDDRRAGIREQLLTFDPTVLSPGVLAGAAVIALGAVLLAIGGAVLLRRLRRVAEPAPDDSSN